MAFKSIVHNLEVDKKTWKAIAFILAIVCLFLWYGWSQAPKEMTVFIPPDLRSVNRVKPNEIYPHTVYDFTAVMFQLLNRWRENGDVDYPKQRDRLRAFMTPNFYKWTSDDIALKRSRNELKNRTRSMELSEDHIYQSDYVQVDKNGTWIVKLVFDVEEELFGRVVKSVRMEYKIRVRRYNVDYEFNPWGIALDEPVGEPEILEVIPK